jgi:hypothetical protein
MAFGSEKENTGPAWTRWLIPSVSDLIFVAFLGVLTLTTLSVRLLGDAGIGWHIRTGQSILATHSIPRVDAFSSSMMGQSWFAWEWLYDVLAGALDKAAGLNGVVLLTSLIIAATFSWTFFLLLGSETNFMVALILTLLAAASSAIHFLARPHVISWFFTLIWFSVLESLEHRGARPGSARRSSPKLWLLPPLMIVWVNLHGGFLTGLFLVGIYWTAAVWQYFHLKSDRFEDALEQIRAGKRIRQLTAVGFATALATLINPYGWSLQVHIYRYLSNRFLMDHIDEFQSPNFHEVAQKCFAILILLTFVTVASNKRSSRRFSAAQILLLLFAVSSGLYASRNLPTSSILLVLVIGPTLSEQALRLMSRTSTGCRSLASSADELSPPFLERMQRIELTRRGHFWSIAAIVLTTWITLHAGMLGSKRLMDAHFSPSRFPVEAVDYLEKLDLSGPILAPDYWGGYLVYRLYPATKVVVDDRHDLYGEEFLKSYLAFLHVEPDWDRFLQQHPPGSIVVPRNSSVAGILRTTSQWHMVYQDGVADVFTQTSSLPQ